MIDAKKIVEMLCGENGDILREIVINPDQNYEHNEYYRVTLEIEHDKDKHLRPSERTGEYFPKIVVFREYNESKEKERALESAYTRLLLNLYSYGITSAYKNLFKAIYNP